MSVYSMTGYASGRKAASDNGPERMAWKTARAGLALELRSVNNRFLDLSFRLPDELRAQEPALRSLLDQRLRRGKVELRVTLEGRDAGALGDPPAALLQRLAGLQDKVHAWLPDAPGLPVAEVLRLAAATAPRADDSEVARELLALAQTVLEDLLAARAREGERLRALLLERITGLRALTAQAEPLVPQVVQAQKQRFVDRWNEALAAAEAPAPAAATEERALAEATAFAIRIDVAEELGRLAAHLDEIERVLTQGGEIGKRLDFLIQELHREANTLGSKSAALELSRIGVDMKVLIEQMREQVQNIE
ncbi:MAG TPA: YicC family protein [Ottowia sp.]|uniref:YicC/YloC family endoribonuclease n=1 Tax=Ottowia sp. TaxID=1898956 RepID=UPI002BCA73CC|nr:YicC/YloC family endoribonuclease [Ottowia sp.]HMN20209.1 YicC family protein [Ottowia sp.]